MNDPANKTAKAHRPAHAVSPTPASKAGIIPWPPVVYLAGIAVSFVLNALYVLPWFGSPMADILVPVGWLALLAFLALFVSSVRTMMRAKTPVNPNAQPEHLVTKGPFGISRNPIYLADTLLLIGLGFVTGITWFLPVAVLCAFITQKIAIEREERWLTEKFGKPYRDYAKRVRRWI
jgi:protein-S-isoprenylcysteine O-methyltransferase Ste14